jgi:LETM1 and EF-hand domain-containing protein 1
MALWLPRGSQAIVLNSSRSLLIRANARAPHAIRSRSVYPLIQYTPATFRLQSSSSNKQTPTGTAASDPSETKAAPPAVPQEPLGTRVWKKVKHEAQHYWHGSKLLVSEVRISSRLQWKILQGDTLTRRERRQVRLFSIR